MHQMLGKLRGISAVEMLDFSAFDALCVKMLATVTVCPNVLIDVAFPFLVAEGFERVLAAKLNPETTGQRLMGKAFQMGGK